MEIGGARCLSDRNGPVRNDGHLRVHDLSLAGLWPHGAGGSLLRGLDFGRIAFLVAAGRDVFPAGALRLSARTSLQFTRGLLCAGRCLSRGDGVSHLWPLPRLVHDRRITTPPGGSAGPFGRGQSRFCVRPSDHPPDSLDHSRIREDLHRPSRGPLQSPGPLQRLSRHPCPSLARHGALQPPHPSGPHRGSLAGLRLDFHDCHERQRTGRPDARCRSGWVFHP